MDSIPHPAGECKPFFQNRLAEPVVLWYNMATALLATGERKEVWKLVMLTNCLAALAVNVISHCICKWLDNRQNGQ